MIDVGRLAPTEQWDQTMLDLLFANKLYPTGIEFRRHEGYPHSVGAVVIIPGRYWAEKTNGISEALSKYKWVLAIRTGDEENLFDPERVFHRNIKWWVQTPDRDYDARLFGVGFTPHFVELSDQPRDVEVFLSAQNTHHRRDQCFAALKGVDGVIEATDGFTRGMTPQDYAHTMCSAKVVPCPSGAVSPDSFRLHEALEAHCVPIADDVSPVYDSHGHWKLMFPDAPFPILTDYAYLPGWINDQLRAWPANANRVAAWWIGQKRLMARWLREDLTELGAL